MNILRCATCGSVKILREGTNGRKFFVCPKGCGYVSPVKHKTSGLTSTFKPSKYQEDIFDFIENGIGNGRVEAMPGSGKTTTIVEGLRLVPHTCRTLFCAFNRHIKDELSKRAPKHVNVSTIHSLGFSALTKNLQLGRDSVDENKVWTLMKSILPEDERWFMTSLARCISLAKLTMTDIYNEQAVVDMIDKYDVDVNGNEDKILKWLPIMMEACMTITDIIDYDDMIWLPLQLDLPLPKYDWIFIDECQDLNEAQTSLILSASGGRVLAVGDRYQSIYGFMGADTNSVPNLLERLHAKQLYLSICYRCPRSHVLHAQEIVPGIECADNAREGVLEHIPKKSIAHDDGDLVLCRTTAPLITECYNLIRQGKKACIRGRDIGDGMLTFIDRLGGSTLAELLDNLGKYKDAELSKPYVSRRAARAASVREKCETLEALCDGMQSVDDLKRRIHSIFDDKTKGGVIFSTVHRAKGDEARRVIILNKELMPHRMATQPWQQQQEQNLIFVSRTRAKDTLIYAE